MTQSPSDRAVSVPEAIARAWSRGLKLELRTHHLAFIAGIRTWCRHADDPALDDARLREIHRIVDEVAHADPTSAARRATDAIGELHEQRLLARTDTARIARSAEYTLTELAHAIAAFVCDQDRLDRQSLTILTTRIRADLADVRAAAERGGSPAHWDDRVEGPLRLTVGGLIEGIDRRRRGMDAQQEDVRDQIAASLEEGWFDAIAACEELLDSTREAIVELHHTAMQEVQGIHQLLIEIRELSDAADARASVAAVDAVHAQIDRVTAWCESRLTDWSEYHQTVHGFIRGWVRMDRDRAVSQRLRDTIRAYAERPWYLRVTEAEPYLHLREIEVSADRQRARRKRAEVRVPVEAEVVEANPVEALRALVASRLARDGEARLTVLICELLPGLDPDARHRLIGELIEALVHSGRPTPVRAGPWVTALDALEVQELVVKGGARDGPG